MKLLLFTKKNHLNTLRRASQMGFTLFCLLCGWQLWQFYLWCLGMRPTFFPRPAAVEAFLPISGLMNLKKLLITGQFDTIHPAALTIFLAVLIMALLVRKGFCGWICPVGFTSQLVAAAGKKLRLNWQPPLWLVYPLATLKYLLLGFFVYIIFFKMSVAQLEQFSQTPYNIASDAKMLLFFIAPSTTTLVVITLLTLFSLIIKNFWCRFLCPYGALLGLLALASPLWISRREEKCIQCKKCNAACPVGLEVANKKMIRGPECLGCGACVAACPADHCLQWTGIKGVKIPPLFIPVALLLILLLFYTWARLSGHWHSTIPVNELRHYFKIAASLSHP